MTEELIQLTGANPAACMSCGKCSAVCPAFSRMEIPPHRFAALARKGQLAKLAETEGIFLCLSCYACSQRCPRGVEPARISEAARLYRLRTGVNRFVPEQLSALNDPSLPGQAAAAAFRKYRR